MGQRACRPTFALLVHRTLQAGARFWTLPYYYHFDDQFFSMFPVRARGSRTQTCCSANWRAELEAQYSAVASSA